MPHGTDSEVTTSEPGRHTQVFVKIAHPGYVNTELARHSSAWFGGFTARVMEFMSILVAMKPSTEGLDPIVPGNESRD